MKIRNYLYFGQQPAVSTTEGNDHNELVDIEALDDMAEAVDKVHDTDNDAEDHKLNRPTGPVR